MFGHFKRPKRINVIGTSGSGKSTFAKRLATALNYPYVELDRIYWEPNWTAATDTKFFSDLAAQISCEEWILDGNYSRTTEIKWEKADMVIWLDFSFPRTLAQAVFRAIRRSASQQELWPGTGNRESFRKSFLSRKSIIWWTITTHFKVRKKYLTYMQSGKYPHIRFIRLRSHSEATRLITQLTDSLCD